MKRLTAFALLLLITACSGGADSEWSGIYYHSHDHLTEDKASL